MASYHPLSKARGVACKWGPQLALLPALRPPRPTGLLLASYICLPCARSLECVFLLCLVGLINTHSSFKSQLEEHLLNETNVPKAPERTSHFCVPTVPSSSLYHSKLAVSEVTRPRYEKLQFLSFTMHTLAMHVQCI